MKTFFLVMTLYPGIQQRAQVEIERVVGKDRLPNINDQQNLPYIMALIKELFRWAPPVPLGIDLGFLRPGFYTEVCDARYSSPRHTRRYI